MKKEAQTKLDRTHFEILGLDRNCTDAEIKKVSQQSASIVRCIAHSCSFFWSDCFFLLFSLHRHTEKNVLLGIQTNTFPQMKRSTERILCSRRSMRLTRCSRIQRSVAATNIPHEPTKRQRRVVAHIHEVPRHAGLMGTHIVVAMMTARTKTCNHQAMYSSVHEGSERVESQVK